MIPMNFRKLRIAWSVFWGLACVLLIVLCVRSYWWATNIQLPPLMSHGIQCRLMRNVVMIRIISLDSWDLGWTTDFENVYKSDSRYAHFHQNLTKPSFLLQFREEGPGTIALRYPYWFAALIVGMIAELPWVRWRFSLRTLLIAT